MQETKRRDPATHLCTACGRDAAVADIPDGALPVKGMRLCTSCLTQVQEAPGLLVLGHPDGRPHGC